MVRPLGLKEERQSMERGGERGERLMLPVPGFSFEGVSSPGGEPSLMLNHETRPNIQSYTHIVCSRASVLF